MSSNLSALTPNQWLTSAVQLTLIKQTAWPWHRWTEEDEIYVQSLTPWVPWVVSGNVLLLYPLFPLGCLGNVLIILAVLVGKRKHPKETFHFCMVTIAILDLVFLLLKFPYAYLKSDPKFPTLHPLWNFYLFFAAGTMYTCSMMADLITFTLTTDRYFSIVKPLAYKGNPKRRRDAWICGLSASVVIAATRLHYCLDNTVVCNAGYTGVGSSFTSAKWCNFKLGVQYFSNTILPFLMVIFMIVLVLCIIQALRSRKRKIAQMTQANQQSSVQRSLDKDARRTKSLMITLLVMYSLNQLIQLIYGTALLVEGSVELTFATSRDDIFYFVLAFRFRKYAQFFLNLFEVASRALNFYAYIAFNKTFRRDFRSIFSKAMVSAQTTTQTGPRTVS